MALEWHAFLSARDGQLRLVGRVEAVDREQIRVTRIDAGLRAEAAEVTVPWRDVQCIAVCGPDRDADLFALLHRETEN